MDPLTPTVPDSKKRHVRLRVAWLALGLFFTFFGFYDLAIGRASIRIGPRYGRETDPIMFWLIIVTHFAFATWLFWKAAMQRPESDPNDA